MLASLIIRNGSMQTVNTQTSLKHEHSRFGLLGNLSITQGGAAPKVLDAMMDLAFRLCPVNVYAYNNIYLAYNKKWWTL
jgi:hypothetical protein